MFVEAHETLPIPLGKARVALELALSDGGLTDESHRAIAQGQAFVMRVGPRGGGLLSKKVVVRVLPPREVGRSTVVPLRWEAAGATARMFPSLDANVQLTEANATTTVLSIVGRYSPPLGAIGERLDRLALSRVAEATVEALVREVRIKVTRGSKN